MVHLTKSAVYKRLNDIRKINNVDISRWLSALVGSDEIPYEVVVFINRYEPLNELTTYNAIYSKRNKSRLFRNLVSDTLPVAEQAIVLSSLLTQSFISASKQQTDSAQLIDAVNINLIMKTLADYASNGDEATVQQVFQMYRTIFKTLFPKTSK